MALAAGLAASAAVMGGLVVGLNVGKKERRKLAKIIQVLQSAEDDESDQEPEDDQCVAVAHGPGLHRDHDDDHHHHHHHHHHNHNLHNHHPAETTHGHHDLHHPHGSEAGPRHHANCPRGPHTHSEVAHWEGFTMEEAREYADQEQKHALAMTPQEVLDDLQRGNMRFFTGHPQRPEVTAFERRALIAKQFPVVAILSCSDSRVPTEMIFDQALGHLFVVRVAGNCISTATKASLQYAVHALKVKVLIVLGHEFCGAVKAAQLPFHRMREMPNALTRTLTGLKQGLNQETLDQIGDPATADREACLMNVNMQLEFLKRDSGIMSKVASGELLMMGAFYAISRGLVDFLPPVVAAKPEAVPQAAREAALAAPAERAAAPEVAAPAHAAAPPPGPAEGEEVLAPSRGPKEEAAPAAARLPSPARRRVGFEPTPAEEPTPEPIKADAEGAEKEGPFGELARMMDEAGVKPNQQPDPESSPGTATQKVQAAERPAGQVEARRIGSYGHL